MPPGRRVALAAGLFALSGLGALVVETLWLRWFRLLLGATAPAVSATLVAFFAGQVLGALWGGRRALRSQRPLVTYGWFELAAAGAALGVPLALTASRSFARRKSDNAGCPASSSITGYCPLACKSALGIAPHEQHFRAEPITRHVWI